MERKGLSPSAAGLLGWPDSPASLSARCGSARPCNGPREQVSVLGYFGCKSNAGEKQSASMATALPGLHTDFGLSLRLVLASQRRQSLKKRLDFQELIL
ncbi:hypothetical protein JZ751_013171 [Albula glossodonta]|uniref:Uncharacterized protein n=1 Tax=Albula glossodonta TaxID=121402 RepID=A0A8T2NWX2_9TELE|nr:hypothetical protein JZ751_013171 [Albula glossodonta]